MGEHHRDRLPKRLALFAVAITPRVGVWLPLLRGLFGPRAA